MPARPVIVPIDNAHLPQRSSNEQGTHAVTRMLSVMMDLLIQYLAIREELRLFHGYRLQSRYYVRGNIAVTKQY